MKSNLPSPLVNREKLQKYFVIHKMPLNCCGVDITAFDIKKWAFIIMVFLFIVRICYMLSYESYRSLSFKILLFFNTIKNIFRVLFPLVIN